MNVLRILIHSLITISLTTALPTFYTYQATPWQGSTISKTISSSPYFQLFPFPVECFFTSYDRALILAGYSFTSTMCVQFEVELVEPSQISQTIKLTLFPSLNIFYMSFFIVLVDYDSTWIYLIQGYQEPPSMSAFGTGIMVQNFIVNTSVSINNPSDFEATCYMKDYRSCTSSSTWNIQIILKVISISSPNQMMISVNKTQNSLRKIMKISYTIVLLNKTAASAFSVPYYRDDFSIFYASNSARQLFSDLPQNFGIPPSLTSLNSVDGNCIIGIYWLKINPSKTYEIFFNSRTYPISNMISIANSYSFPSHIILVYYSILCARQLGGTCILIGQDCWINFGMYCTRCTSTKCIQCDTDFCLEEGLCKCCMGVLVRDACTSIAGCVQPYSFPDGIKACSSCNTAYYYQYPIDGQCQCLKGSSRNDVCNTITECITPQLAADGTIHCSFCNVTAYFQSKSSDGLCYCQSSYQLVNEQCIDRCGDGILANTSKYACDDGNVASGDGCSANCSVQPFYKCHNGTKTSKSACVYQGVPLPLTLKRISRSFGLNQGVFQFQIKPALTFLNNMNLQTNIFFLCNSEYSINSMSYNKGTLIIIVDYTKDMEGALCNLIINYEDTLATIANSSLSFSAISSNTKLILSSRLDIWNQITFIFKILSYIALAAFFFSFAHKMAAVQLLTSCQIVYFSCAFSAHSSFFETTLQSFSMVTGQRLSQISSSNTQTIYPFTAYLELRKYFIQNTLIVSSVLLTISVIQGMFLTYHIWNTINNTSNILKTSQIEEKFTKNKQKVSIFYDYCLFPFSVGCFLMFSLSLFINSLKNDEKISHILTILNSLSNLMGWTIIAILFKVQLYRFFSFSQQTDNQNSPRKWYVPLFLSKIILISIFIMLGATLSFDLFIFAILIVIMTQLMVLILKHPYTNALDNLGSIICQITALFGVLLACLSQFQLFSEVTESFLFFILQGIILISILMTFIRSASCYYKLFCKKTRKNTSLFEQNIINSNAKRSLEERQKAQIELMHSINPYRMKQHVSHNHQEQGQKEQLIRKNARKRSQLPARNTKNCIVQDNELQDVKKQLKKSLIRYKEQLMKKK